MVTYICLVPVLSQLEEIICLLQTEYEVKACVAIRARELRNLFCQPDTSHPTFNYSACWIVMELLVVHPSHLYGRFLGLAWYWSRMLLRNYCSPGAMCLQAQGNIFSQCTTWLVLFIALCLTIVTSDVGSKYWTLYVSDLCDLSYVWPDIMVKSWYKWLKVTSPSMVSNKYAELDL